MTEPLPLGKKPLTVAFLSLRLVRGQEYSFAKLELGLLVRPGSMARGGQELVRIRFVYPPAPALDGE
jgi:hypothetical protein